MNEFVEQCRREWKRLGVRRAVADDMAAELATDLGEGASPEDVLGSDSADARSFAAEWARERGVIPGRMRNPSVIARVVGLALALVAIAGVVLMLTQSTSSVPQARATVTVPQLIAKPTPQHVWVGPPLHQISVTMPPITEARLLKPDVVTITPSLGGDSGVDWAGVGLGLSLFGGISLIALAAAALWRSRRVPLHG